MRIAAGITVLAVFCGPFDAHSQVVIAHATTDKISAVLTNRVADTFEGRRLMGAQLLRGQASTPSQVAAALCGSSNESYLVRVEQDNHLGLARDQKLGQLAAGIIWPACLRITPINPTAAALRKAAGSQNPLLSFLGSFRSASLFSWLSKSTSFVSPPIVLTPKPGTTAQSAIDYVFPVSTAGPHSKAVEAVGTTTTALLGHIVEQATTGPDVDPSSALVRACSSGPAFDAAMVVEAYGRSSAKQAESHALPGRANVMVVDNGFFGADPGAADPFAGSVFSPRLFRWNGHDGVLGPDTPYGEEDISPNNYSNGFSAGTVPTAVEGHGTHVAGLAMGGPDFLTSLPLTVLSMKQTALLQFTILNIGKGGRNLIHNSERQIRDLLAPVTPGEAIRQGRIVNMSVAYDGDGAAGILNGIFLENPDTLFVVAAGNSMDNLNLNPEYPGALGGASNVISVAAHDSGNPAKLAWFSNYGVGKVGIAAPGCGIQSWVDASHPIPVSGTSQATPLVTFAASLLVTLDSTLTPAQIRDRLFASGDLLAGHDELPGGHDERRNVISQSKLDIPDALLLFDDVLVTEVPIIGQNGKTQPETWIGQVKNVWFLRCRGTPLKYANSIGLSRLWAFKRQGHDTDLVWGERAQDEQQHCEADETAPAAGNPVPFVTFERTAIVRDGRFVSEAAAPVTVYLPTIDYLLLRGPSNGHI